MIQPKYKLLPESKSPNLLKLSFVLLNIGLLTELLQTL